MRVEELRIGNLLLHEGEVKEVNEIGTKEVNEGVCGYLGFKSTRTMSWLEHKGSYLVNPIPLTEEWLVKFGFVSDEYENGETYSMDISTEERYDYKTLIEAIVMVDYINIYIKDIERENDLDYNNVYIKRIYTVHQLQNLYFALTGEELKIETV